MRTERIIIYPKDIQRITGKSERYGRLLIKRIKGHFKKEDHQLVTVDEFCSYTGIKIEQVAEYLYA
jgi:GTP-sensing pleiotropic transcriptional regulator CodY